MECKEFIINLHIHIRKNSLILWAIRKNACSVNLMLLYYFKHYEVQTYDIRIIRGVSIKDRTLNGYIVHKITKIDLMVPLNSESLIVLVNEFPHLQLSSFRKYQDGNRFLVRYWHPCRYLHRLLWPIFIQSGFSYLSPVSKHSFFHYKVLFRYEWPLACTLL